MREIRRKPEEGGFEMKRRLFSAAVIAAVLAALPAQAGGLGEITGGSGSNGGFGIEKTEKENRIALADLNASIEADGYVSVKQEDDGFVYVYASVDGSMPYVIIGRYGMDSEGFADKFTDYMKGEYPDLDVVSLKEGVEIGGKVFDRVEYSYSVGEYEVRDARLFAGVGDETYMFGTKEVPALGFVVGSDYLEGIAGSFEPLDGSADEYGTVVDAERSAGPSGESGEVWGGDSPNGKKTVSEPEEDETETERTDAGNGIRFSESMAPYEGIWCPFADGFQVYLPKTWSVFEVPEDQKAGGCMYQAGPASAAADPDEIHVAVNAADVSGLSYETIDDVAEDLRASGYDVEETMTINGIECVSYSNASPKLRGVMFYGPNDGNMVFALIAYNGTEDEVGSILCSLRPYEG